jgi:hypothetical protein
MSIFLLSFFASALWANFDDADLDLKKDPYSIRMEQETKAMAIMILLHHLTKRQ